MESPTNIEVIDPAEKNIIHVESSPVIVMLLTERNGILTDIRMLHGFNDGTVSEVRITLQYILMVEHELVKNRRPVDVYRTARYITVR